MHTEESGTQRLSRAVVCKELWCFVASVETLHTKTYCHEVPLCVFQRATDNTVVSAVAKAQTSNSPLSEKSSRRVLTWRQRGSPKKPLDQTHFQFENRSRTTWPLFLHSFALPDEAVQFPPSAGISNRMDRPVSPDLLLSSSPPPRPPQQRTTHNTQRHTQRQRQNQSIKNDLHVRHIP